MRVLLTLCLCTLVARADGPMDNLVDNVRPIPPKGAVVPDADKAEIKAGLDALKAEIEVCAKNPKNAELLPDVEIYHKAVRYALEYDEIYIDKNRNDIKSCQTLLKQGLQRAKELKAGMPSWTTATGLVVRGYRSKIDGSVQPYGLVVPASYSPKAKGLFRLDFWWHGRGETLTEVNFIEQRSKSPGEFTPRDAFVLHPYGRYCNANKFAGEVDTFECLEHAKKHYPIDESRLVARGFSMGGAACWQFGSHFPGLWVAAAPGAGFAETAEFLGNFQKETVKPTWYEERLWKMYNATDYAANFFSLPVVAYSGEIDRQKQAADVMAREMKKSGIELTHIIGPKTAHSYEKNAKEEINCRIDAIVARGKDTSPKTLGFTTNTLRYNKCSWIEILGMQKHWQPALVLAEVADSRTINITTKNITALKLDFGPGTFPLTAGPWRINVRPESLIVPGSSIPAAQSDRSFQFVIGKEAEGLAKRHGLQGPIDDAFMDRFIMVKPTSTAMHMKTGQWAEAELAHATKHWRSHFRGDAITKDDTQITEDDIRNSNLILWGDPSSNAMMKKVIDKLPIKWTKEGIEFDSTKYDASTHVPVLIYPNPLNPKKYVVLNSGFTFREFDYLNNARQVSKLPDYALVDVTTPPNSRWPGKIARAGFFGEKWEIQTGDGK